MEVHNLKSSRTAVLFAVLKFLNFNFMIPLIGYSFEKYKLEKYTMHKVTLSNISGYKTELSSRGHVILSDEPLESNGTDTGMNPYELLLSSIGACKAITMRMYAERKGWKIDDISMELIHDKIPAEECDDCETKTGKIDKIEIRVNIKGDLTEEQKARILEIGERCPVQKTILSEIKLTTTSV